LEGCDFGGVVLLKCKINPFFPPQNAVFHTFSAYPRGRHLDQLSKVLQSDNRGEFINTKMKELLEDLDIQHITSFLYKGHDYAVYGGK